MENSSSSPFVLFLLKIFIMAVMFGLVFIIGNLPLRWYLLFSPSFYTYFPRKQFQKGSPLLNLANAFSGGLFLTVGLLHILHEVFPFENILSVTIF